MKFVKNLYNWVLHWADTPYGKPALAVNSFAESSFFPIPPDVLLIALGIAKPRSSFSFALICSIFSVLGGILGYYIGFALMESVGWKIVDFYNGTELFNQLLAQFREYNFWAVLISALTPIPYKIFTISAGAAGADFGEFLLASAIGRSVRFFAVSGLIFFFGKGIKTFIDKYFNLLSILFVILLVAGFILIKFAVH